jgi:hypothetical protein
MAPAKELVEALASPLKKLDPKLVNFVVEESEPHFQKVEVVDGDGCASAS